LQGPQNPRDFRLPTSDLRFLTSGAPMELASRIVSVLLGLVVAVFILWPVTIPVGFGQAWWASRQVATRSEPAPSQPAAEQSTPLVAAPAPPPVPAADVASPEPEATAQAVPSSPDQGKKRTLLASEKAEADRVAALNSKGAKDPTAATPPSPPTKLYYRVTVRDAATLVSGGVVIRLAGITARDADATCKDKKGRSWRCGAAAKSALAHLIHARAVTCELPKSGKPKDFAARCTVAGADLSMWLVRQGWAKPTEPPESALAEAAEAAKKDGVGLWRASDANEAPQAKSQ
jgi:endonuclease YncB( thermonuclease family)